MINSLHKKLKLKPNQKIAVINKPADFEPTIATLPEGAKLVKSYSSKCDVIFWFVKKADEVEAAQQEVLSALSNTNVIWIAYPKGTSGMQSDLNRDKGWEPILARKDISFIAYIAFNEVWSTFCIRRKTEADKRREAKPAVREIFKYADSKYKTVILPDDLKSILEKHKKANTFFETLSYSNKREYVEWVITAKRLETRQNRITKTIELLLQGNKNPAGR
jgi:Bacteriocin-protection, YdeI or OmpD-Associated